MYEVVGHAVATLPDVLREIMYFLGTWTFYIPLYIILWCVTFALIIVVSFKYSALTLINFMFPSASEFNKHW